MSKESFEGYFLNGHIRELLEEKNRSEKNDSEKIDEVKEILQEVVEQARIALGAAERALGVYVVNGKTSAVNRNCPLKGNAKNGIGGKEGNGDLISGVDTSGLEGETRRGVTSREMSGEMGGDTI